jgi:Ca-activated chloride channel family protein
VFIVDVSGSMNGFPVEVAKKLMRDLLNGLKPFKLSA